MNAFTWLLKREYWENKGGMFWAPVWTAGVLLFFTLCALVIGIVFEKHIQGTIHIGIPLKDLVNGAATDHMREIGFGLDASLAGFVMIMQMVLFFVLFFYLLGALYDDRRDRSVLFWKSLPISDMETVISKLITAAIVAPLLTFAITVVLHIAYLLLLSLTALMHGVNPITLIWLSASPLRLWAKLLVLIPINALWALPTYGWLLLCSSLARSKPFLWAIVPPVIIGWGLAMFDVLNNFSLPNSWYWRHVFLRWLFSICPGSWNFQDTMMRKVNFEGEGPIGLVTWTNMSEALLSPSMWIGAFAGTAMIIAAVYFRRYRTESQS